MYRPPEQVLLELVDRPDSLYGVRRTRLAAVSDCRDTCLDL